MGVGENKPGRTRGQRGREATSRSSRLQGDTCLHPRTEMNNGRERSEMGGGRARETHGHREAATDTGEVAQPRQPEADGREHWGGPHSPLWWRRQQ